MNLNLLTGLNEDISPASLAHKDGALTVCKQMRVDKDGLWSKITDSLVAKNTLTVIDDNGDTQTTTTIKSGITPCNNITVTTSTSIGTRAERGIYFYMATTATNGSEGVTSKAVEYYVDRYFDSDDIRVADVPKIVSTTGNRVYRTKIIYAYKGAHLQRVPQNSPTEFFYVGSGSTVYDYLHDSELGHKYEGRGSKLADTPDVIARYDGRIFAFFSGYARWSSVGRPTEFPQPHNVVFHLNYSDSVWNSGTFKEGLSPVGGTQHTITLYPTLESGVQAETRLFIPELAGKTITTAYEFKGKLWVWTTDTTGYIMSSGNGGYRYIHLSNHFGGIVGTIVEGGSFLYGCDSNGAWANDGQFPKKISDGIITPPTIDRANWVSAYEEYWFGSSTVQYVYNSRLGTVTSKVASAYTPEMMFWVQADDGQVKEDIRVTILLKSGACTVIVYQGVYPDTSDCTSSGSYSIANGTHITTIEPNSSGRYTGISLTGTTFELAGLNIEAKAVNEYERSAR